MYDAMYGSLEMLDIITESSSIQDNGTTVSSQKSDPLSPSVSASSKAGHRKQTFNQHKHQQKQQQLKATQFRTADTYATRFSLKKEIQSASPSLSPRTPPQSPIMIDEGIQHMSVIDEKEDDEIRQLEKCMNDLQQLDQAVMSPGTPGSERNNRSISEVTLSQLLLDTCDVSIQSQKPITVESVTNTEPVTTSAQTTDTDGLVTSVDAETDTAGMDDFSNIIHVLEIEFMTVDQMKRVMSRIEKVRQEEMPRTMDSIIRHEERGMNYCVRPMCLTQRSECTKSVS